MMRGWGWHRYQGFLYPHTNTVQGCEARNTRGSFNPSLAQRQRIADFKRISTLQWQASSDAIINTLSFFYLNNNWNPPSYPQGLTALAPTLWPARWAPLPAPPPQKLRREQPLPQDQLWEPGQLREKGQQLRTFLLMMFLILIKGDFHVVLYLH